MNKIINLSAFTPKKADTFLFDTNVLIKLFYPALGARNCTPYIDLYRSILKTGATLLISSIQISEFVNRCIRFQFDLYKKANPDIVNFKEDYRETNDYQECMNAILEIIESDILGTFTKTSDDFDVMNDNNLFMHCFSYDFNNAIIAELSRNKNAILVTDDGDYANYLSNIHIVTNNRTILMFQNSK